ncbi:MAG: SRPBCC family protein, partial [Bacteroidota bacterium]
DKWLPVITTCQLEGEGEGAKRICTTAQGNMLETILEVDAEQRVFKYSIDEQPLLPIENIIGTMQVLQKDEETELLWQLEFTLPDESSFPMVKQAIEGLYAAGANGLAALSNS